jgi:hypothetical protein
MAQTISQELERTLVYKRANYVTMRDSMPSLRELLTQAIEALDDPDKRQFVRQGTNNDRIVTMLNFERRELNSVFGEVLKTFPGQPTFAAERDPQRNLYRFLACLPPTDNSEFVRGVILFYAYGDGVIIVASNTFKANEFEEYLNWLLREAGIFTANEYLSLDDEPLSIVEENLDKLSGAKSVRLSCSFAGLLGFQAPVADTDQSKATLAMQAVARELRSAAEKIKPGVGAAMASVDESTDLDIVVEVKLPKNRRTTREALDAIAVASRMFRGVAWTASLSSGFRLGNGSAAVSRTRKILHINKYPDYSDARTKMADALEDLMRSRLIGPLGLSVEDLELESD